jgi:hypothetical protein
MTFFDRGYLTKEIPLGFGVAKNSGAAPLNFWESPVNLLDPEFIATCFEHYRYPLEKNGHGRKRRLVNHRPAMPTLLNDTNCVIACTSETVFTDFWAFNAFYPSPFDECRRLQRLEQLQRLLFFSAFI